MRFSLFHVVVMSLPVSGVPQKRRDARQQSIRSMFLASSSIEDFLGEVVQDHSISPIVSLPSSSKDFSIHGDNAHEDFGGEREEVHDGMHDDLEMEGSSDDDEDGGDYTKDVELLPHRRGRGRPPRNKKFNHCWRATRPWLMHIAPRDGVHGYMKCATFQGANVNTRWGDRPGIGCSFFQLSSVKEHEGSALHAHAML